MTIDGPGSGAGNPRGIQLISDGTGSTLDVSALTSFADEASNAASKLNAINGGTILNGLLTNVIGVELTADGTGTISTNQFTTFERSDLLTSNGAAVDLSSVTNAQQSTFSLIEGSTVDLSAATNIDGASFDVSDGVTLTLPQVTSYTVPAVFSIDSLFRATGAGSQILFPMLNSITGSGSAFAFLDVEALDGGVVDLSQVTNIAAPSAGAGNPRGLRFESNGGGSLIDLSALTDFTDEASNGASIFEVINAGAISNANTTNLVGVDLILDSTGTISTSQILSYQRGVATITGGNDLDLSSATNIERSTFFLNDGGTADLSSAVNIDGASFEVNDGASQAIPLATSYTIPDVFSIDAFFRANGAGSELLFPMLGSITGSGTAFTFLDIEALDGGNNELSQVATIAQSSSGAGNPRGIRVESNGTGSTIDLFSLTDFTDEAGNGASNFEVINGGDVDITNAKNLVGVDLILDSTGTLSTSQITSYERGIATITGGNDLDLSSAQSISRSTLVLNDGGTADPESGNEHRRRQLRSQRWCNSECTNGHVVHHPRRILPGRFHSRSRYQQRHSVPNADEHHRQR